MKTRLRLLAVDHNAGSGPAQQGYRLLLKQGFEILLVVPNFWKEAHGEIGADIRGAKGLQIEAVKVLASGAYHRSWYLGLGKLAASFQPDLIWAHAEPENLLAWQAGKISKKLGCPLVLVSWRNIDYPQGRVPYKFSWVHWKMEQASRTLKPLVLCYNDEAVRLMGKAGFRTARIDLGVDTSVFKPGPVSLARQALKLNKKAYIVGFAGRCQEEKGVADLIDALAKIKNSILLVVGDGPALGAWKTRARRAGVELVSRAVAQKEMAQTIQAMDVLVLPSRTTNWWKEQYGRILVEAMACGRAVLGSSSGAIPQVIGAGSHAAGLIFPEKNISALRTALKKLRSPLVRRRFAAGGKKNVALRYGWPAAVQVLSAVLKIAVKDVK